MEIVAVWLALCLIPAYVASTKGRSPVGFFLLGVVVTPVIALIVVLIMDPGRDFTRTVVTDPAGAGYKAPPGYVCGRCLSPLSPAWRDKCKHCGARYAEFAPIPSARH